MNYELAKKLKDAGYPQKNHDEQELMDGITIEIPGESVYAPSLSELIEACGDRFMQLDYFPKHVPPLWGAGAVWKAGGREEWEAEHKSIYPEPYVDGDSPEIAVANLWLALNKK